MGEGRGTAIAVAAAALLGLVLLHSQVVDAATYAVGDGGGWTFRVSSWPTGKTFRDGDTLVFNYNSQAHDVVVVNKASHDSCTMPQGAKVFKSGKDQIKLAKGPNFFICSIQGHCQSGMKIAVIAM